MADFFKSYTYKLGDNMNNFNKKCTLIFSNLFSYKKLPKVFLSFAAMQIGIVFFSNMYGVFINTFLLKATGDFNVALKYNMIVFFALACVMILSVFLIRRKSVIVSIKLGLILYCLIYLSIIIFEEHMAGYYPLIALIFSAAGGFCVLPYGVLISEFTNDKNRDMAIGYLSMWTGIAALSMPAIAGILISMFNNFNGYRIMFVAALMITLYTFYLATKIEAIAPLEKKSHFGTVIKYFFKYRVERYMYLASTLSAIRDGVFRFILSLILYQFIKDEAIVGINAFVCGIAAVIASWAYSKIVKSNNRFKCMTISLSILLVGSVMMLFSTSAFTIVLFGILSSLSNIFIVTPQDNYTYLMLQEVKRTHDKRPEYQTIKEFFLATGRNVGILLTLLMIDGKWGYMMPLIVIIASQYLMIYVTKLAARELEKEKAGAEVEMEKGVRKVGIQ